MTATFINPLARRTSGVVSHARTIKEWTREMLELADDAVVSVNELQCSLPDCPPKETIILVLVPGEQPRQASLHIALREVTKVDVAAAIARLRIGTGHQQGKEALRSVI